MLRAFVILALTLPLAAQKPAQTPRPLDPSFGVEHPRLVSSYHQPLPEEYIWTANDAAVATNTPNLSRLKQNDFKVEPRYFRRTFTVATVPQHATLYLAGPREAHVFLNGTELPPLKYGTDHHMGFGTMLVNITSAVHPGANTLAIAAIRGYGSHHHTNALKTAWLNSGEVLVAKILPAAPYVEAPPLLITDTSWRSTTELTSGWQQPSFDDIHWPQAASLGSIESSPDFFQWNADAGLYDWPGYIGAAPYMATLTVEPTHVETQPNGDQLLDFGRELNGRLLITSAHPLTARISYGESLGELHNAPHFANTRIVLAAHHTAYGPKTGFRYALVHFDAAPSALPHVAAESIYYPAKQIGTFTSSDPLVNRIFESAVYTAHLSMQDSILDGIKRDRGRWIGDDEVINRTILDVYGNLPIVKQGLDDGIGPAPVTEPVNGLPGYSAWWIVAEYEYIRRTGDLDQLRSVQDRMLQLLALMEKDLDARHIYAGKGKPFVDWSPGFSTDTPEARKAVHYEYMRAFVAGSHLLQLAGHKDESVEYMKLAFAMSDASTKFLQDERLTIGDRWQTNIAATLTGLPTDVGWASSAKSVLERAGAGTRKQTDVITPYYGSYMLEALSRVSSPDTLGNQKTIQWVKTYWGGMLENGATSFWEAWDPSWAGPDPHAKLQADDKVGYNASLSHGWSSGPASWLLENILGVTAPSPFQDRPLFVISPQLAGMQWIKGDIATVYGSVHVEASETRIAVTLPPGPGGSLWLPGLGWSGHKVRTFPNDSSPSSEADLEGGHTYEFLKHP